MKQKISIMLILTILLCSLFSIPQASAISSFIGEVKDPSTLPEWADQATLRRIVQKEYIRMSGMKSTLDNGVSYFDYGQTTDDWMQVRIRNYEKPVYYLCQTFAGGTSYATDMSVNKNVSFIIVAEESYAKGEAYTLRDTAAEEFIGRAIMGSWGPHLPTSNQYWVGDKAYQEYQLGFLETDYSYKKQNGDLVQNGVWQVYNYNAEPPTTGTEARYAYKHKGDVDEDGGVKVSDVVALRQFIVAPDSASVTQQVIMDMDGDFDITVSDVVALRQQIVKG